MSDDQQYSKRVAFRLRGDHLEYVDGLQEKNGCTRSEVLRDIITTHRAIMTSELRELLQGSPLDDITSSVPPKDGEK